MNGKDCSVMINNYTLPEVRAHGKYVWFKTESVNYHIPGMTHDETLANVDKLIIALVEAKVEISKNKAKFDEEQQALADSPERV